MTDATSAPAATATTPSAAPAASPAQAPAAASPAASPAVAALTPPPEAPKGLIPPGKDAKPEEWNKFFREIGAPEKGDGYGLKLPEGGDQAFQNEAAQMMAEAGLLPQQAQKLVEWWNGKAGKSMAEQAAAQESAMKAAEQQAIADDTALKTEWGQNYEKNMNAAKQAVSQFMPKDKAAEMIDAISNVVGYKATMTMMHAIGKGLGEGSVVGVNSSGSAKPADPMRSAFADALAKSFPPKSS